MLDLLLDDHENVGFCTLLETTASHLFTEGCDASSLLFLGDDDEHWFGVCVPAVGSSMASKLLELINDAGAKVPRGLRANAPIFVQFHKEHSLLKQPRDPQIKFVNKYINRFLRAYEHTYFDLLVPRHCLDGRPVVLVSSNSRVALEYAPVCLDLFEVLLHYLPSHSDIEKDCLSLLMANPEQITPSWRILVDGVRHFEGGNHAEAILCACSAVEILSSPAVERWLGGMTLRGQADGLEKAVREMGNPLRFDLCISAVCKDAFVDLSDDEKLKLLNQLRAMNRVRNRVVHGGEEPEPTVVVEALQAAATFVCKVWLASLDSRRGG